MRKRRTRFADARVDLFRRTSPFFTTFGRTTPVVFERIREPNVAENAKFAVCDVRCRGWVVTEREKEENFFTSAVIS